MKRTSRASIIFAHDIHVKIPANEQNRTHLVFSVMKNRVAHTSALTRNSGMDVQGICLSMVSAYRQQVQPATK